MHEGAEIARQVSHVSDDLNVKHHQQKWRTAYLMGKLAKHMLAIPRSGLINNGQVEGQEKIFEEEYQDSQRAMRQ